MCECLQGSEEDTGSLGLPSVLKALLDKAHSAWMTWTDPSLPLVEFATQLLPVSLTCLMFEFLAAKGPSPKARAGIM